MRYLLDSEILRWNQRLEKTPYMVYPKSNLQGSHPHISFRQKTSPVFGNELIETLDPTINGYKFVFSVAKNRVDDFFDIFNKLIREQIGTKTSYSTSDNDQRLSDIQFSEKIIETKDSQIHTIGQKEYIRYSYTFSGKLSQIMAYVFYLEDTIEFFSKIWGYSEEGHEICLIKYPIGSIVSHLKDKSKDFLILDYEFRKLGKDYHIDYQVTEVLGGYNSVVRYGDVDSLRENEICFSRNGRIDDILN